MTERARFMTDDEYFPFLAKKNIRPAIWRWRDLAPRLAELPPISLDTDLSDRRQIW